MQTLFDGGRSPSWQTTPAISRGSHGSSIDAAPGHTLTHSPSPSPLTPARPSLPWPSPTTGSFTNAPARFNSQTARAFRQPSLACHAGAFRGRSSFTDCTTKTYTPDGKASEIVRKAGTASAVPVIPSHSAENTSPADCQQIFVERK
jgi:hypothetical protein